MDPYPYLLVAEGNWIGQFADDENSVHQNNIDKIYESGSLSAATGPSTISTARAIRSPQARWPHSSPGP